jgi:hypothetical protein
VHRKLDQAALQQADLLFVPGSIPCRAGRELGYLSVAKLAPATRERIG